MRDLQIRLFRYSCYSIAVVVIVLAVFLQLARLFTPQLAEFRVDIEKLLTTHLEHSVSIKHINARWYGLSPHLFIENTTIFNEKNQAVFKADIVDLKLDVLQSLFRLSWVWQEIRLKDIEMDFYQDNQGNWSVLNIPLHVSGGDSWELPSPLEIFDITPQVQLQNLNASFYLHNKAVILATVPSVTVENSDSFHRLTASLNVDEKEVADVVLEQQLDSTKGSYSLAFLSLKKFPLETLLKGVYGNQVISLSDNNFSDNDSMKVDGSIWFDFNKKGLYEFYGELFSHTVPLSSYIQGDGIKDVAISANVQGSISKQKELVVGLTDLTINGQQAVSQLLFKQDDNDSSVWINKVQLQSISHLLLDVLSEFNAYEKVYKFINTAAPSGELENIAVVIDKNEWKNTQISANVKGVSIQPVDKIPGISDINGYIQSNFHSGYVDFKSEKFVLFPQIVYEKPLWFRRASGQVAWALLPDKNQIIVSSNKLNINTDFGQAAGYFYLDVPWVSDSRKSDFALQIGLKNSSADHYRKLVPNTISPTLLSWLDRSVQSAQVPEAGFIYRGGFSGGDSVRSVQLFVSVEDGGLIYSDDWPMLAAIDGQAIIDNRLVNGHVKAAKVFDESIENISVKWPVNDQRELKVLVDSELSASTALRFLNDTWLQRKVGDTFKDWSASGNVSLNVDVNVPLFDNINPQYEPRQKASINFLNPMVRMGDTGLDFKEVSGELDFSNRKGFYSDNLRFKLFDENVNAKVSNVQKNNERFIFISGDGSANVKSVLRWLDDSNAYHSFADGVSSYKFDFRIPLNGQAASYIPKLTLESSLEGIAIDMPDPLGKPKKGIKTLKLISQLDTQSAKHQLFLGDNVSFRVQQASGALSGVLLLNRKFSRQLAESTYLPGNNFFVGADFKKLSIDAWVDFLSGMQGFSETREPLNLSYDIRANQASLQETILEGVVVSGNGYDGKWQTDVKSSRIAGKVQFNDDFSHPIKVHLDYLNLPESSSPGEGDNITKQDPLKDFNFSLLKPADVVIQKLLYGDKSLGFWKFKVLPYKEGVHIDQIAARFSGFTLGKNDKGDANLRWYRDIGSDNKSMMVTRFSGGLQGGHIERLFDDLGYPVVVKSQQASFDVDVQLQGSPAVFAIDKLSGGVRIAMKEGVFVQDKARTSTGFLRLLSLFNFDTWLRRLSLNFSDLSKKGVVYDDLTSYVVLDNGWMYFQEPFYARGPASDFTLAGKLYYPDQEIDAILVATVPARGNLTLAAALAGGVPTALGVYLAGKIFKKQVDKISSLTYSVKGNWNDPDVKFVDLFTNRIEVDQESGPSEEAVELPAQE